MALGTLTVFNEAKENFGNGLLDLSATSDFSCMLITSLPTAADSTPDSADYTEVTAGGNYSSGGIALTTSWTESGGTVTFNSSTTPEWLSASGSPTNCKAALVYSETAAGEDAVAFIDLTTDGGTTPHSLVDGKITINFNPSGLFDLA